MQHRTTSNWNTRRLALGLVAGGSLALASVAGGCNNAGQGAFSGAALGAVLGLGLGSLTGDMGKGAAAGAIIGAGSGAVLGDQNNRKDRRGSYRSNEW